MKTGIKRHWKIATLFTIGTMCLIYYLFADWGYDDPYITLRYAKNLGKGLGFVYNPEERILSTTSPFFALLISLLRNTGLDLPQLAVIIGIASISLGGLFLWDLGHTWGKPIVGWLGLFFYPMFPLLLRTLSSETTTYLMFCLGAFSWYVRKNLNITAIFCALAFLTRPDGALIPILLSIHYVTRIRRPVPWKAVGLFLVVSLPWILFSILYFGSSIPVTLVAKQQQGAMEISQRFAPGLLTILGWGYSSRYQYWFIAGLAIIGFISIFRENRLWGLFLSWILLYFAAFSILGVSRYFWYYAPLVPGLIMAAALGADTIYKYLVHRHPQFHHQINILGVVLLIVTFISQFNHILDVSKNPDTRLKIYRAVGEWIDANTEANVRVGTLEVGIIGYYANRPMIDFAGIIQPDVAKQLSPDATYEDSALWATQAYQPEYLVLNPDSFPRLMDILVKSYCQSQKIFEGERYSYIGDLTVYSCDWNESIIDDTRIQSW